MRILMLSRDRLGLDPQSPPSLRWKLLCDQGVELDILVTSPETMGWEEGGIRVRGSGGANLVSRLSNLYQLGKTSKRPDLITAADPTELGLVGVLLKKFLRVPLEIQDHGGYFAGSLVDEPVWWLRKHLADWTIRRANVVRTVSPKSCEGLKKRGALRARIYWLPITPQVRFAQAQYHPEPGLIVTVGRLVSIKRHDLLLRAFALFKKHHPEAKLAILGDGPLHHSLIRLAHKLGIASSVEFPGRVDPLPWLERASVFSFLSSHEGWGVAAVEAAMVGVPVVMSNTGCAAWLKDHAQALVIEQDDPETIAQTFERAIHLSVQPLRAFLTPEEAARQQVEQWNHVSVHPS